jgi:hypothetical protein
VARTIKTRPGHHHVNHPTPQPPDSEHMWPLC